MVAEPEEVYGAESFSGRGVWWKRSRGSCLMGTGGGIDGPVWRRYRVTVWIGGVGVVR